jgi:hypothetical protein
VKPRLLDLFCGAGGAAVGYHRAGFAVPPAFTQHIGELLLSDRDVVWSDADEDASWLADDDRARRREDRA